MSAPDQLSRFAPYIGRLLEDEYIQEEISQAITSLRRGSRRARGRSASEAIKDRRLRAQLRDAASSLTQASRALNAPPPKRHRFRRALLLTAALTAVVLAWQQRAKNNPQANH
jgi:hypothetical protein